MSQYFVTVTDLHNDSSIVSIETVKNDSEPLAQAMNKACRKIRENGTPDRELGPLMSDDRPELWAPVLITVVDIKTGFCKQWNFLGFSQHWNAPKVERITTKLIPVKVS